MKRIERFTCIFFIISLSAGSLAYSQARSGTVASAAPGMPSTPPPNAPGRPTTPPPNPPGMPSTPPPNAPGRPTNPPNDNNQGIYVPTTPAITNGSETNPPGLSSPTNAPPPVNGNGNGGVPPAR